MTVGHPGVGGMKEEGTLKSGLQGNKRGGHPGVREMKEDATPESGE